MFQDKNKELLLSGHSVIAIKAKWCWAI